MYKRRTRNLEEILLDKSHAYINGIRQSIKVKVCEIEEIYNPHEDNKGLNYLNFVANSGEVKCELCIYNAKKLMKQYYGQVA